MKKYTTKEKRISKVRRQRDPLPWKYCILTVICGVLIVAGFFIAARLHFSSITYGISNATLRKVRDQLETENRRLKLDKEVALSEINKTARQYGFQTRTASNIEIVNAPELPNDAEKNQIPETASLDTPSEREMDALVNEFETQKGDEASKPAKTDVATKKSNKKGGTTQDAELDDVKNIQARL
ncbi:MAG: hypothetical protein ACK5NT_02680 [Pyrinomonadaceae bacterium]